MRKKTTEKTTVSLPIGVARMLRKEAKEEHTSFSAVVARACREHVELAPLLEKIADNSRDAALFSRAAFYAMCDVAAVARKERPEDVQRKYLAKASKLLARRSDSFSEPVEEGGDE